MNTSLARNERTASRFSRKRYSHAKKQESSYKPYRSKRDGYQGGRRKNSSQALDISQFIRKASLTVDAKSQHTIKHSFADFNFCEPLQRNLKRRNFIVPTPIQDQAIPYVLNGKDVVGLAKTGTGKTGVFLWPLIHKIAADPSQKILVITPTRELALQIDGECRQFSQSMRIFSVPCIGGMPIYRQLQGIKRNPNIIIGTPGRLVDLRERNAFRFESFTAVVVDEIDRMLDMGFIRTIRDILEARHPKRQTLFFSATIPQNIKALIQQFLREPAMIEIPSAASMNNIRQDVVRVPDARVKFEKLHEILSQPEFEKVLIFNETKRGAERLAINLSQKGFRVQAIHGDKRQRERERSLTHFRENKIQILVATDVAARGLDIDNITHVINYTIPQTYDDYIHRIGRTGRGVRTGTALTFV